MSTVLILRCGFLLIFFTSVTTPIQSPGVLDKIKSGLEYASSYIETAKEIANLVSKSLGHGDQKRGDDGKEHRVNFGENKSIFGTHGLMTAFFRLLGLDSSKINAIAVNSAIFLAQMISTAFNLKPKIDKSRDMKSEPEDDGENRDENWAQGPMRLILGSTNERNSSSLSGALGALELQLILQNPRSTKNACFLPIVHDILLRMRSLEVSASRPGRIICNSAVKNSVAAFDTSSVRIRNWAVYYVAGERHLQRHERIQRLVRHARDENLPTHLVNRVDGLDTACVRLLVCKASPVIRAAQRSLDNDTGRAKWDMTSWLPTREEFQANGDNCEENHEACQLFNES